MSSADEEIPMPEPEEALPKRADQLPPGREKAEEIARGNPDHVEIGRPNASQEPEEEHGDVPMSESSARTADEIRAKEEAAKRKNPD